MVKQKLLRNIYPYNDIFYRSCLYNSFFPIVKSFNVSIIPFLINDYIVYKENSSSSIGIDIDYIEINEKRQLEEEYGIKSESYLLCENIVQKVINALQNNRPIILYIDCFLQPLQPQMYQKVHSPHTILIYGFNDVNHTFDVIEHKYRDKLSYEHKVMSYEKLEKCYNGFIEYYCKDTDQPTYYEYYLSDDRSNQKNQECTYKEIYINTLIKNKKKLKEGFVYLEALQETIINSKLDERDITILNNIINAKISEKYKLGLLKVSESIIQQLDEIIYNWNMIRLEIVKKIYSTDLQKGNFNSLHNLIKEILTKEIKYLNEIEKENN